MLVAVRYEDEASLIVLGEVHEKRRNDFRMVGNGERGDGLANIGSCQLLHGRNL